MAKSGLSVGDGPLGFWDSFGIALYMARLEDPFTMGSSSNYNNNVMREFDALPDEAKAHHHEWSGIEHAMGGSLSMSQNVPHIQDPVVSKLDVIEEHNPEAADAIRKADTAEYDHAVAEYEHMSEVNPFFSMGSLGHMTGELYSIVYGLSTLAPIAPIKMSGMGASKVFRHAIKTGAKDAAYVTPLLGASAIESTSRMKERGIPDEHITDMQVKHASIPVGTMAVRSFASGFIDTAAQGARVLGNMLRRK